MPGEGLLHRPSTVVGNPGITSRARRRSSWIRPLWPHVGGGYISSCPKGQVRTARTALRSDPRSGIGSQVRGSQGPRVRFSGGTRRLRTCSEPKGGRPAGPPTSSFGRFRMRHARRTGRPCATTSVRFATNVRGWRSIPSNRGWSRARSSGMRRCQWRSVRIPPRSASRPGPRRWPIGRHDLRARRASARLAT